MHKKIISFILTFIFTLTLFTSCKSNNTSIDKMSIDNGEKVTNVYKNNQINVPDGYTFRQNDVIIYNENIYTFCINENKAFIFIIDLNGENEKIINLKTEMEFIYYCFTVLSENEYLIYVENSLYKIDNDGNTIELYNLLNNIEDYEEYGNYKKLLIKNDKIYLIGNGIIYIFSITGEFLNEIPSSKYIYDIEEKNGVLYVKLGSASVNLFPEYNYILNENTLEFEEIINSISPADNIEQNFYKNELILGDNNYDIYCRNSFGLFGYNTKDETATLLINWQNSDIYETMISVVSVISPEKVICAKQELVFSSYIDTNDKILILTKIPDDEVKPKILLTIPLLQSNDVSSIKLLSVMVSEFNMSNEKYRIVFNDYSKYDYSKDIYITTKSEALEKFNLDIGTGVIPDIIFINTISIPVDNYISKGLFIDIYDLINEDPEFDKDNLINCVREAFELNDKLYQIPICFELNTLIGNSKAVSEKSSLTLDEMYKLDEKADGRLFYNIDKSSLFHNILKSSLIDFIDTKNKTCDFTSEKFIKLLNYINDMEDPESDEFFNFSNIVVPSDYRSKVDNNELFLSDYHIGFPKQLMFLKHWFGDDYVIKGYPTENGNGTIIDTYIKFGITDACKNKEGAWEFIKFLLSDEMQTTISKFLWGFPVTISNLTEFLNNEKEYYYYIANNGIVAEYNSRYSSNYETTLYKFPYPNTEWLETNRASYDYQEYRLTDKDINKFMNFLNTITIINYYDGIIMGIIDEETSAFFANAITAEQCADYIQNRVTTYLNEQK